MPFDLAALKELAAGVSAGGGMPTDILELIGADKYCIVNALNGQVWLPVDDLTETTQMKLILTFPPKENLTIPTAVTSSSCIFLAQYQYSTGYYFTISLDEGNNVGYQLDNSQPRFFLDQIGTNVKLWLPSSVGSYQVDIEDNSEIIIFYNTL